MREAVGVFGVLLRVITTLNHIGAAALTFMMFLTLTSPPSPMALFRSGGAYFVS